MTESAGDGEPAIAKTPEHPLGRQIAADAASAGMDAGGIHYELYKTSADSKRSTTMSASFVYVTVPKREDALQIGRTLVEERLAACVNVFEGMTSVYRWEGRIEESDESVMIAKTKTDLVSAAIERVISLHGYSCPCVVSWPISEGNEEYLRWIAEETRSE